MGSDRLSVVGCLACTESHRWPRGGKGGGGGDDRSIVGDEGERMTRDAQLLNERRFLHSTCHTQLTKVESDFS